MSLNHISGLLSDTNTWANTKLNSLSLLNGLNLNNSGITNCSSINGEPIPPFTIDVNPMNIIYQPGGSIPPFSNQVTTWAAVIAKASQANINQIIYIYFDDSKVSPAPISTSYDFQGRGVFKAHNSSVTKTVIQINDGVTISNLARIEGPALQVLCQSKTAQSLAFANNAKLIISNNSELSITADSLIPAILLNATNMTLSLRHGCNLDNALNGANYVVNVTNAGVLTIGMEETLSTSSNTIESDAKSTVTITYDGFVTSVPTQVGVLGTLSITAAELAGSLGYNDAKVSPPYSSSNIQGALDSVKTNYALKNSTNSMTAGAISCTSLLSSGTVSSGTNSLTCGSIISSGTFSNGTNASTTGALACTSMLSSGTVSSGTNSLTCGSIISSGTFSNGTNASTTGALACTSMLSSGTVSSGTNSLTCGSIISSGTFSNGTNASTTGAHSCTSLTSTGTISCGTNSMTCGSLSCSSVASTGLITQERIWVRFNATAQSTTSSSATIISWANLETSGGSSSNFSTSLPLTQVIIPQAGVYLVMYEALWAASATGIRDCWCEVNNGGSAGSTRRWAETNINATTAGGASQSGSFIYKFNLSDTVCLTVDQTSGGALNFSISGNQLSSLQLVYLSE